MKCITINCITMNAQRKQAPKLDDLLHEIKKLSTKMKEGKSDDSTSSKEGTITSQPTSGKKIPRKRQKTRHKKQRGRKRQLKYANLDIDSSSFTDCTDEDIIRDYIENITATLSDSDVDGTLKNGALFVRRDFSPTHDFRVRCSPEMDETDSLSESLLLGKSHKKCRRYKRHSMEQLEHQIAHISPEQKHRLQVLAYNFSQPRVKCGIMRNRKCKADKGDGDYDMEGVEDGCTSIPSQDSSSQATSSTDNSESSSNSHSPGSEADDEGEESCVETGGMKKDLQWWQQHGQDSDSMSFQDSEGVEGVFEQSLTLISGRPDFKAKARQVMRTPMTILCETGGFVAYANHKIKYFVHERDPNELTLYVTNKKEQDQVLQLAGLYSLHCLLEDSGRSNKVILTKTINTKEADQSSLKLFLYKEVKLRCRKNRLPPQWNSKRRKINSQSLLEGNGFTIDLQAMDVSLPVTSGGNHQSHRSTGWPIGPAMNDNNSSTNPIRTVKRPKNSAAGYSIVN